MTDTDTIRALIGTINAAWRTGRFDGLEAAFHDDMVIAGPGYRRMTAGASAAIESYREFSAHATVLAYTTAEPAIDVWGDVAVGTYAWTMTWRRDGDAQSESGTDQFVFARFDGAWKAVYRLVLFEPAADT